MLGSEIRLVYTQIELPQKYNLAHILMHGVLVFSHRALLKFYFYLFRLKLRDLISAIRKYS